MLVKLSRGYEMSCDPDTYLRFYLTTGGASLSTDSHGYAMYTFGGTKRLFHRWVVGCEDKSLHVAHKDSNPRNNWEYNLEIVTKSQNRRNLNDHLRIDNKSGFRGVIFQKSEQKYVAFISIRGKRKYLGIFANFEDACSARLKAEEKYGYNYGSCPV